MPQLVPAAEQRSQLPLPSAADGCRVLRDALGRIKDPQSTICSVEQLL